MPVEARAVLPVPFAVAFTFISAISAVLLAPPPFGELVAGDPPVVVPVIEGLGVRVPPAAVIVAVVDLVVGPGALLPDPFAVAGVVLGNAGCSGAGGKKRK